MYRISSARTPRLAVVAFPGLEVLRAAHARGRLVPTLIALAVAAVLIEGALRKSAPPPPASDKGQPAAPSPSAPPPRGDLDRAPLSYVSDYFQQVAERARSRIVLLGVGGVSAVVVEPGLAVSSRRAALEVTRLAWRRRFRDERAGLAASAGAADEGAARPGLQAHLVALDDAGEVAFFELPAPAAAVPFRSSAAAALRPAAFVAAISLAPDGRLRIVPGHLIKEPRAGEAPELSLALPDALGAAAIVDLEGIPFALAIESGAGARLFSLESLRQQAALAKSRPRCEPIEVASEATPVRGDPGARGLRVARVAKDAFAGDAPRAGDLLLEWDSLGAAATDALRGRLGSLAAWAPAGYVALRAGRRVSGRVTTPAPDCAPGPAPPLPLFRLGLLLERDDAEAWSVALVAPASPAQLAGMQEGDLIVSVDRLRGDAARRRLETAEEQGRGLALGVRRDGEALALAVPAAEAPRP